jgi:hypothetical protein
METAKRREDPRIQKQSAGLIEQTDVLDGDAKTKTPQIVLIRVSSRSFAVHCMSSVRT